MSAGWAWRCDGCGELEINDVNDFFDRPPRDVPTGWSVAMRRVPDSSFELGEKTYRKYFCETCSDKAGL